jgi:hypothetical protein
MTTISANHASALHSISAAFASATRAVVKSLETYRIQKAMFHELAMLRGYQPYLLSDIGLPGFETMTAAEQEAFYASEIGFGRGPR